MLKAKFEPGLVAVVLACHVVPLPVVMFTNDGARCAYELLKSTLSSGMYSKSPGAAGPTVMLMDPEEEPPELLAQTVYVVEACSIVGVPQMLPLVEPKESPFGKAGLMAHEVTGPPLAVGVLVLMAELLVNDMFSGE